MGIVSRFTFSFHNHRYLHAKAQIDSNRDEQVTEHSRLLTGPKLVTDGDDDDDDTFASPQQSLVISFSFSLSNGRHKTPSVRKERIN